MYNRSIIRLSRVCVRTTFRRLASSQTGEMNSVSNFWFVELTPEQHFMKDPTLDAQIKERFGDLLIAAKNGEYDEYARQNAQQALNTVIVLDQFSRNVYRDTEKMYDADMKALEITDYAIEHGFDKELEASKVRFLYMPYMHCEDLEIQERGVTIFTEKTDENTAQFAISHRDIVKRFGRFPHRNCILGRECTAEEVEFLKTEGSSF